jgi:non-heme chloroperoxidase
MRQTVLTVFLALLSLAAAAQTTGTDITPHRITFVTVQPDVKLEVIDRGGTGQPVIFLAGLNHTAHAFDNFASKFTDKHHVYGITRRGLPPSSIPSPTDANYDADRLGDDVLAVMTALNISRPVLVGESIAGEELSSIGSRQPNKVTGLIYLDASGPFAFYVPNSSAMAVDIATVRRDLT